MAASHLLSTRPGTRNWQVRYNVPKEHQAAVGKKEIWRSLKTAGRSLACSLAPAVLAEIVAEVQEAQRQAAPPPPVQEPTRDEITAAAQQVYARIVESDLGSGPIEIVGLS